LRRAGEIVDEPELAPQRAIANRPDELEFDLRDDRPMDLAPPAGLDSPWP
jgi:hypothetical protein